MKRSTKIKKALEDVSAGVPAAVVAKERGLSVSVIETAIQQASSLKDLAEKIRESLADTWYLMADLALKEITPEKLQSASAKDLITLAAIATDKARVAEGKPTEIVAQYKAVVSRYMQAPADGRRPPPVIEAEALEIHEEERNARGNTVSPIVASSNPVFDLPPDGGGEVSV